MVDEFDLPKVADSTVAVRTPLSRFLRQETALHIVSQAVEKYLPLVLFSSKFGVRG